MSQWKHASVRIDLTVNIEDDGEDDLHAAAIDEALSFLHISSHDIDNIEVVGPILDGKVK